MTSNAVKKTSTSKSPGAALEQLRGEAEVILAPLGYEVVALENSPHGAGSGSRTLTLFIDFLGNTDETRRIGLQDCVAATKAVDELFETTDLLTGHYTLEVSSPGIERPLRKSADYKRFQGRKVKLHTFRPLEAEELGNPGYWERNKKQKNFIGRLEGLFDETAVQLSIDGQAVRVPLALISKAHLEADFKE